MLLGGVVLSGLAFGGATWFADMRQDEAKAHARATADRAARAGRGQVIGTIEAANEAMAAAEQRQAALLRQDRTGQAASERSLSEAMRRDGLQFAAVTDATGRILWSSHAPLIGASLTEREAFVQHRAGRADTLLTPALLDLPGGPRSLLVSRTLADSRGGFGGMVVVAIDPRRLDRALADAAVLPGLGLALLRADGTPLAGGAMPGPATATATIGPDLAVAASFEDESGRDAAREAGLLAYLAAGLAGLLALSAGFLCRREPLPAPPPNDALPAIGFRGVIGRGGVLALTEIGPGVERLTGWTVEAALRPGWRQRGIDAATLPLGPDLPERLRREDSASAEFRFRRADAGWMWLRETLRVTARSEDGIEVAGALEDISAERALALQAATSAKFATLGEMAAGLAHELNQPIAIMSMAAENAAEALEAGEDGVEEALTRLRRIMAQADRAKAIVTQLRAFSRVDVAALEPVDLGGAVQGMMVLAGQALRDAGVVVQLRLPDVLPPVVGQVILVEQVLLNLVLNARDAMLERPAERRRLRIEAETGPGADAVTLRVLDTGPGLSQDVLEKLFEPFYTTKPPGFGTGLGLSISRTIMRGLGGRIVAGNAGDDSEMGAEFTLVFRRAPMAVDTSPEAHSHAPAPRWPAAT